MVFYDWLASLQTEDWIKIYIIFSYILNFLFAPLTCRALVRNGMEPSIGTASPGASLIMIPIFVFSPFTMPLVILLLWCGNGEDKKRG